MMMPLTISSSPLIFILSVALLIVAPSVAMQEETIPVSDTGEGQLCDQNPKVANICLACTGLPFDANIPLVTCCSNEDAMKFCDACVNDKVSCAKVIHEMKALEDFSESEFVDYPSNDEDDDGAFDGYLDALKPDFEKRFGTLFLKSPKRWSQGLYNDFNQRGKRFGRLYIGKGGMFGKRKDENVDKRYGVLGIGSSSSSRWFGKRDRDAGRDKRFGTLHMGSGGFFGKRNEEEWFPIENDKTKRFGTLGMRWRPTIWDKRSPYLDDADKIDAMDKRYGRLFMSSKGMFGKRSKSEDYFSSEEFPGFSDSSQGGNSYEEGSEEKADVDKRYGHVFLGKSPYFGKRSLDLEVKKRFGRLFMNRRKGVWFG